MTRHEQLIAFMKRTAADLSARSLSGVRDLDDWVMQRPAIRREWLYMLGLDPMPRRAPLKARITRTLERPDYRVENLVYESLPGLYVTGNLYLPRRPAGRLPAVLYVCGHSPHPLGAKGCYQDRAARFADLGYVCLALDTLEFGEVAGIHHGLHDLNMWSWLSMGYTPAGVEAWNAIRALDYLETRSEVDGSRIGMTGISGGGATTWFTAAVDERIAAAVPVCSTYTFGSQAAHWLASGQCDCIYPHNTFMTDFPVVAALIAPRPLLICSGRRDSIFPPDGYHEVFRRAKGIYDLYAGSGGDRRGGERIKEVDEDAEHSDTPLFRQEARQWMNRWLKGDETPLELEPIPAEPRETPEDLACLSGLPAGAVNYSIHDRFVRLARPRRPASLEAWSERRHELIGELKAKVFRWFPDERIPFETRVGDRSGGWAALYADYQDVEFQSEAGSPVRARLFTPRSPSAATPLLIYAKRPGDSITDRDLDELLPVLGRHTVLILNPRLTEESVTAAEYADIERTAVWIGRTVASMQVWDLLRAVEWAATEAAVPSASITLYGKGAMGILGIYAGLLDERIRQVVLGDPPVNHRQGPALLNVLRVTEIPEAAGAFAPRRLVFLKGVPPSFGGARHIYHLHGRPDRLTAAGSLPEALELGIP